MWIVAAFAAPEVPSHVADVVRAIGTVSAHWSVDVSSCRVKAPDNRWSYVPYAVLGPPDTPDPWVCTPVGETTVCSVLPAADCAANLAALHATGTPWPTLDGLFGLGVRKVPGVPQLLLLVEGDPEIWRFVHRSASPTVSPPIPAPSDEVYGAEFATLPVIDLRPVLGRPGWGFVTVRGGEGMGNNASGEYTYTLVTVSLGPSGPVSAGQVALGGHSFWRSVGDDGFSMGDRHDVRCAVVRDDQLVLFRSCRASGDPRSGSPEYTSVCDPACFAGKEPVRTFEGRGGGLFRTP